MKLNPFAMWTFSKKFAKKNNWFGQESINLYKIKIFVMNQSTTMISRTAGQCAPRPMRWCRWVPHVVGKRASAFGGKHQRCSQRIPSSCAHHKATDILATVANAHKQVRHTAWHSIRWPGEAPSVHADAAVGLSSGSHLVHELCTLLFTHVHVFFWILNEIYKHVKICHLFSKLGVFS